MNIAYLHYHLRTGGVTTVIKQQVDAIKNDNNLVVITGRLPEEPFPVELILIPELEYSDVYQKEFDPVDVADSILQAIYLKFNGPCDVLHVHNPTLAKNRHFLKILKILQDRGVILFLQIHDFAEDGRPTVYSDQAYPQNCHYGVINSRDYRILTEAGLKPSGLHRLENAVSAGKPAEVAGAIEPCVLYPIRAIRRKNVGEAILLHSLCGGAETLVITRPPNSPSDLESYADWKQFVRDHGLLVEFEKGLTHNFNELMACAKVVITTSIGEGFGFSYLEPWLFNKIIQGRRLPDICVDFEKKNIRLEHMYTKLAVPLNWIDHSNFYQKWRGSVLQTCAKFRYPISTEQIEEAYRAITENGNIDFGLLDEFFQRQVILKSITGSSNRETLLQLNPALSRFDPVQEKSELVENNRLAVIQHYNRRQYATKLMHIYQQVATIPVEQEIDKRRLFSAFLNLTEYSLLKWCPYGT